MVRKLKIAILVSSFPPKSLAGTEIATYNTARHLAKRGHEVHVITSWDKGLPKQSNENGFVVHRGKVIKKPFLGFISYFIYTFRIIRRINPDLIDAQGIDWALYAFMIKMTLNKSYVAWSRGSDIYLPSRINKLFYRFILRKADAVIALTKDMENKMLNICRRDIIVIPNGIDLDKFAKLNKGALRSKLQIEEGVKVILYVGTLRQVKGVKYLIQAMSAINEKQSEARLILVGDGKERRNLEKLTETLNLTKYVTFLGRVPNEEVPECMAAADIFILPSLSEGFPVTILEAMASGLPVVTTDITGLSEIVQEGVNGFLVKPKNPDEINQKVSLLLQDVELRRKISRNNEERARYYTWEKVIGKLDRVYQETVEIS